MGRITCSAGINLASSHLYGSGGRLGSQLVVIFSFYKPICQKKFFFTLRLWMGTRSHLLAQVHPCSFFLQINLGAKAVPSFLSSLPYLLLRLFPLHSVHTRTPPLWHASSGGMAKLSSAGTNMITAKVRARLSKCVSTFLSLYLSPCHSIPAAGPAAAPAAYANSWWSATAGAVGT